MKRSWRWSTTRTRRGSVWVSSRAPSTCQGHSMEVEEDHVYTRVEPSEVPSIIHATCYDFYASILKTGIKPGGGNPRTRGRIHCLRDHVSQHRLFPPGVEIILHLVHAAHTVRWYLTDNGYFVTRCQVRGWLRNVQSRRHLGTLRRIATIDHGWRQVGTCCKLS